MFRVPLAYRTTEGSTHKRASPPSTPPNAQESFCAGLPHKELPSRSVSPIVRFLGSQRSLWLCQLEELFTVASPRAVALLRTLLPCTICAPGLQGRWRNFWCRCREKLVRSASARRPNCFRRRPRVAELRCSLVRMQRQISDVIAWSPSAHCAHNGRR